MQTVLSDTLPSGVYFLIPLVRTLPNERPISVLPEQSIQLGPNATSFKLLGVVLDVDLDLGAMVPVLLAMLKELLSDLTSSCWTR